MARADRLRFAGLEQPVAGVVADRLESSIAGRPAARDAEQRLRDQPAQDVQRIGDPIRGAVRCRRTPRPRRLRRCTRPRRPRAGGAPAARRRTAGPSSSRSRPPASAGVAGPSETAGEQPEPVDRRSAISARSSPGHARPRARSRAGCHRGAGRSRRWRPRSSGIGAKSPSAAVARSTNRRVAGARSMDCRSRVAPDGGSGSDATWNSVSPSTPSASRLVASTVSSGASARRRRTISATGATRCSQLSMSSTRRFGRT